MQDQGVGQDCDDILSPVAIRDVGDCAIIMSWKAGLGVGGYDALHNTCPGAGVVQEGFRMIY